MVEPVDADGDAVVVLAVTFTLSDLDAVRHRVRDESVRWGLDGDELSDWVTAVNELTTNAVRHGSPVASLRLTADGVLSCHVQDQGRGFDTSRFVGRATRPTLTENGGIGLWLVEHTTQILTLTSGPDGTSVSVAVRRSR